MILATEFWEVEVEAGGLEEGELRRSLLSKWFSQGVSTFVRY